MMSEGVAVPEILQILPVYLLMLIMPLGVAGQNIGAGIVALILLSSLYLKRRRLAWRQLWSEHKIALISVAAYLITQILATVLNPASPARFKFNYTSGYLMWALLPPICYLALPKLRPEHWRRVEQLFTTSIVAMGIISLSQAIWGWRIVGTSVEFGFPRAQGLYSHPMTFGYVCLVLAPLVINAVFREPRRVLPWITAAALAVAIVTSRSRTVQLVTAIIVLWNIWCLTKGRIRLVIMASFFAAVTVILSTNNPVSERFRGTLHRDDVRSDYLDDRVAFWHVHWNMLKERPLLGHGEGIITSYRVPYYEAIGLKDFIRQYEAHNMLLQIAVNVGLVGLGIFLIWVFDLAKFALRLKRQGYWCGDVALQTIGAIFLGAITQNAFQDSAVRFAITVLIAGLWLSRREPPPADRLSFD